MKKLFVMFVMVACLVVFPAGGGADCQDAECYNCLAFTCQLQPMSGYCSCDSGGTVGGGRYCSAGGGSCIVTP